MIQKQTWVNICDSSSALWVKVFQLYGGFFRKTTSVGFFIKGSVRVYKPQVIFYKGYTKKKVKKGLIRRSILVRQTYNLKNNLFFLESQLFWNLNLQFEILSVLNLYLNHFL